MENNYVVYHLHDDRSINDSCTKFDDYLKLAIKYNQKAIALTNHGNIFNWVSTKEACDAVGIKYIHGCEVYLTESLDGDKIRDNYHTILLAKNYNGVMEINRLVSLSNQRDHFYYKPRLSFDEFLAISDNVICISACLASPLNHYRGPYLDSLLRKYDFYEIQYHNCSEQKSYNLQLLKWSIEYNKPLIAGTDTHSLDRYKAECRLIQKAAKKQKYDNEDEFDLTYKSYDELVEAFKAQNALPIDVILEAINNTNIMASMVEEFELDKSFKYPKLSDNEDKQTKELINRMFVEKLRSGVIDASKKKQYIDAIREEMQVFEQIDMVGFMLFMSELIRWCHENNIPTGPGRGSVCGSVIAYIIDITDVDPIKWGTIFSRFANKYRKELGDKLISCLHIVVIRY